MFHKKSALIYAAVAVLTGLSGADPASAQMNNRPFSFKNSADGGPGMSQGGRQAVINDKLFGSTPENLLRGSGGELVDVVKGPGKSAIVFRHGTDSSIPGFHGTSFRSDDGLMQAGVFNAFFGPYNTGGSFSGHDGQFTTPINSWAMNMMSNGSYAPYAGGNSVDSWTTFVSELHNF